MPAFNIVRFRVKPGRENEFIDAHKRADPEFGGFRAGHLLKTGERSYCMIGEWENFDDIIAARPKMIALLDSFRDCLEDLGNGMGVTDPISGDSIVEMMPKSSTQQRSTNQESRRSMT